MRLRFVGRLRMRVAHGVSVCIRACTVVVLDDSGCLLLMVRRLRADHAGCRHRAPDRQQQRQNQHQHSLREGHLFSLAHELP